MTERTARQGHAMTDVQLDAHAVVRVPALLSVATTAQLLDCSARTVRRRIADRSLPAVIEHGRVMVRGDELRAYVEALDRVGARPSRRRTSSTSRYDFLRGDATSSTHP